MGPSPTAFEYVLRERTRESSFRKTCQSVAAERSAARCCAAVQEGRKILRCS